MAETDTSTAAPDAAASDIKLRLPSPLVNTSSISSSASPSFTSPSFTTPPSSFILRTWHVTHSTLPMWKNKRNVRIKYSSLPDSKLDDLVTYQPLSSNSVSKVQGIDTPRPDVDGAYTWRGKGWLKIATSKWELLGWGEEKVEGKEEQEKWAVTYFAKTLFTPAGLDVYAGTKDGLSESTVDKIKHALQGLAKDKGKEDFATLINGLFEIKMDGDMPDGTGA